MTMNNNIGLFAVTIDDQIACAEREIAFREKVYPRLVGEHRMPQRRAQHEIMCMKAILENLHALKKAGQA